MIPSKPTSHSSFSTNSFLRWIEYGYYSNVLIGLAAAFLAWQTTVLQSIPFEIAMPRLVLLFCTTCCFYCLHDYFTKYKPTNDLQQTPRVVFWKKFGHNMRLPFAMAAITGCMIAILFLNWRDCLLVFAIGLMCLFYSFPLLPFPALRRWKNHAILKLVVLAGIWTLATIWLVTSTNTGTSVWIIAGNRLAFVLMICIPFDVRDAKFDKQHMQRTLLDWPGAHLLEVIILFSCAAGILLLFLFSDVLALPPVALWAMVIHCILTAWLVIYAMRHPDEHRYFLLLDLQLIVQPIIVGLCYLFA